MHEHSQSPDSPAPSISNASRMLGILLAAGSIVMVVFMAMHPSAHTQDFASLLDELAKGAAFNGFVHGTLMIAGCIVFLGLFGLAERLGLARPLVRSGLIAYAIGQFAGIGAATVNGFLVPGLAAKYASSDPATLDRVRPMLALCFEVNHTLARLDVFAMSIAVLLWSTVLAHWPGTSRIIGIAGIACAALPLAALLAGRLPMNIHGFGAFILLQSLWSFSIAVQLIRGRI